METRDLIISDKGLNHMREVEDDCTYLRRGK